MKKAILILLMTSCLLFLPPLITRQISVKARLVTLTDDPFTIIVPDNFTTIQEAVNNASSGATIFVRKGTYYENVIIDKTITLVGEDRDFTIIDGSKADNVIYIRADDVTVKNFTIRNSGTYIYGGILVDRSTGSVIADNKIVDNYEGISLLYSSNNVVSGNTILRNNDGIYLYYSSNNVVSGNSILSSIYNGIYLFVTSDSVISDNVISHNEFSGMSLYSSNYNMVFDNTISSNSHGINLALSSENNTIYHNNFNNTHQAWSELTNIWDYGHEGNYWSDYIGQDLDEDGIGDASYDIEVDNKDDYPLMGMFSNFSVTLGGEEYSLTVVSNSTISLFKFQIGAETGNKIAHFNVTGEDGTVGFCRVTIPTELMNYPYIVVVDGEEIVPALLNVSSEARAYLFFTYLHKNQTITIISSKTLALYLELLDEYLKLQMDLYDLNETYYALLQNFTQLQVSFGQLSNSYQVLSDLNRTYYELLDNYVRLQMDLYDLNETYYALSGDYNILLYNYSRLQTSFYELNFSYLEHLVDYSALIGSYNILLNNYGQLQTSFLDLNDSYLKHLLEYSEQMQNLRNLTYIIVALTAILIVTTVYLSKRAHANVTAKISAIEEK